ncbi:MAG: two-component system response regulator [Bacteroidetes bacterium GWA2_30_7]|nr:MAG: two-component system response regulator [Bacteroidetes bacterium GWA2_30_7]
MKKIKILWVDDEIDLLKPHILFLEQKGYEVITTNNGTDAIEIVDNDTFDLIFLDENMPGLSGLQTLSEIKRKYPSLPVVMITKSEAENIMEQAIGSKISDYLIKPVNPNQILLSIKKNVDHQRLISEKTTSAYQTDFMKIGMQINECVNFENWVEVYKKLIFWELELEGSGNNAMDEVLKMQKNEANNAFAKFIKKNYISWFDDKNSTKPLLSPSVFKSKVFPLLKDNKKVVVILIDNLRLDQWKILEPKFREVYNVADESVFCSILPTATQYSRNSMFSGLLPSEIQKLFPDIWLNDEDDGGKNLHEEELLKRNLQRNGLTEKFYYEKVFNNKAGKKIIDNISNILHNQLSVIVFNFVDMLSHARTEIDMIRELADDEAAYRSLTLSWFEHSPLFELIKILSEHKINLILTTDHGAVKVQNAIKVIGDRNTTTNIRYKQGRSLNYNPKEVFEITQPQKVFLPLTNVSSTYIFAQNTDFFAYPNNYNHYVKYYKDTFQHGGVSLEEMLIPAITMEPK